MVQNTPLALLPLIAGLLIMAMRFYLREGADSIFRVSFLSALLCAALLILYMTLTVLSMLPDYAWVGFGGAGFLISVGGIWSFNR